MQVLHITCGFPYSSIYKNMFNEFAKSKFPIQVYIPQHSDDLSIELVDTSKLSFPAYSNKVIKGIDKYLYFTKIFRMKRDIALNFNLCDIDIIHAHSLFSDGGVAYEIYKKHKIPYIVAVRDTDVNKYYRKAKHLRIYATNILRCAKNIVFLSKTYRDSVIKKYVPEAYQKEIEEKSVVIPNGISGFWLDNLYSDKTGSIGEEVNLIFVGRVVKRKNVESAIKASGELEKRINKKVNLTIVGEKKDAEYFEYISQMGKFDFKGYLPKEELIKHYRASDIFIMPSFTETFGLVYAEALSQGLPIIYSYGQGFDGQFEEGQVGYGVDPYSLEDIVNKTIRIIEEYDQIYKNCVKASTKFDWRKIINKYLELYNSIIVRENIRH